MSAQKKVAGRYRNHFGSQIEIYADSTFKYTFHFDMVGSWTKATWSLKQDTVYLYMTPTNDIISYENKDGSPNDKVILSYDEKPERFTPGQYARLRLPSRSAKYDQLSA